MERDSNIHELPIELGEVIIIRRIYKSWWGVFYLPEIQK